MGSYSYSESSSLIPPSAPPPPPLHPSPPPSYSSVIIAPSHEEAPATSHRTRGTPSPKSPQLCLLLLLVAVSCFSSVSLYQSVNMSHRMDSFDEGGR